MHSASPRSRARRRTVQLTERDRRLLQFAAEHRFVITEQVAVLLQIGHKTADERLRALRDGGYLVRSRELYRGPAQHRLTRAGLRAIGSDLPVPGPPDLSMYGHDVGLGWLMLAARRGRFGPVQEVVSERRMRSDDGRRASEARAGAGRERHGVRLGGVGPGGRERLHYPDLVLVTASGHRIAFELELTSKPARRRETILAAYGGDRRIDAVVYLVTSPAAGRAVERSARRVGISDLVRVHRVSLGSAGRTGGEAPAGERRAGRAADTGEALR